MTLSLAGAKVAARLQEQLPLAVVEATEAWVVVRPEKLVEVMAFLKADPDLFLDFLTAITAVDYPDYFEMVYHLTSLRHNHSLVVKARLEDKDNPQVDSLIGLWRGADLQEREIYDLMGIGFRGHPDLKRILLWEGFPGHPLRKDFLWVKPEWLQEAQESAQRAAPEAP